MEDILLSDSDMNCLSISSNDFVCGWLGADGCCRAGCGPRDWKPPRGRGLCSLVGAGSVVSRDVPPYCLAAGAPARVLRRLGPEDAAARDAAARS